VRSRLAAGAAHGAAAGVSGAITRLARLPTTVTPGTFVFVLSDFLVPPPADVLRSALGAGWDLVPVIVQDPVWERSFPDVSGATLPLADPESGVVRPVRLSSAEVGARRDANEQRAARLQETFLALGVDPVLAGTAEPRDVHAAFLAWARARLTGRRHR
jgi:hypothetical protein